MKKLGFTPKQIRVGRERAGIVAVRAGSGSTMHTTWKLAVTGKEQAMAPDVGPTCEPGATLGSSDMDGRASVALGTNEPSTNGEHGRALPMRRWAAGNGVSVTVPTFVPALTLEEEIRVDRRASHFFQHRGVNQVVARSTAVMLVVRDRAKASGGSCLECQAYTVPKLCRALGPKAIGVVWQCPSMRRDGP